MIAQAVDRRKKDRIEELKRLIEDDGYVSAAVRRIAQVLSDELLGKGQPGVNDERKRY